MALATLACVRGYDRAHRWAGPRLRQGRVASRRSVVVASDAHDSGSQDKTVVVFGATGQIGSLVVQKVQDTSGLVARAVVRDEEKAADTFGEDAPEIRICDWTDPASVREACEGADAIVWCVSGGAFSNPVKSSLGRLKQQLQKLLGRGGQASETPTKTGLDLVVEQVLSLGYTDTQVAVLSSAAITRPGWSDEKKKRYDGCVDIPIVRLNPFGVLDKQRALEQRVRESGVRYSIVRPVGLNREWPEGRPVLSQGDVAVGRVNRADVAAVLVDAALCEEANGKSMEVITLKGYESPIDGFATAFARLRSDEVRKESGEDLGFGAQPSDSRGELAVAAEYSLLMQLLPGEVQDATRLEMGKTYEQLDKGKVDRKKGAAPTAREVAVATGARAPDRQEAA